MHSSFKANFNLYPATNLKSLEVNNPLMSRTKVRAASQCQCQPMAMFGAKRSRVQLNHIASLLKQWSSVLSKNPLQCVHLEVCSVFKAARQLIVYCWSIQSVLLQSTNQSNGVETPIQSYGRVVCGRQMVGKITPRCRQVYTAFVNL